MSSPSAGLSPSDDSWVPKSVDVDSPSAARVYDYFLGGGYNFAVDRSFGESALRIVPELRDIARANREFLYRAVRTLADQGIDQFLDIGCGLPTTRAVHQIALERNPETRTVYVDNEGVAVAHGELMLQNVPQADIFIGDLTAPQSILDHPHVQGLLATGKPTAVLTVAVMHFILDEDRPVDLLTRLLTPFPAGSYFVFSHGTADSADEMSALEKLYNDDNQNNGITRTWAQLSTMLAAVPRLELIEPGLVWNAQWRPARDSDLPKLLEHPEGSSCYAAVGVLR
ncbi:MAG TPA: SAM-dependent methyltransferase [Pseudonocardiaceae bacterium]|jgi:hypothetical protein|nr:SAM-dependent methyltransferase [Pseudonocardiaceae bacterium]